MLTEHPLEAWLSQTQTRPTDFARAIGCSKSHLAHVIQRKRGVSPALARKIEEETAGAVTMRALFDVPLLPRAAAAAEGAPA